MYFAKKYLNTIKRQVFEKAENVHNKQADILYKATTPTFAIMHFCYPHIHTFQNITVRICPPIWYRGPKIQVRADRLYM